MKKTEQEIQQILSKYNKQILQINKMLLNMYDISNIRFWCSLLSSFRKSEDLYRDILEMEALVNTIVMSYGRLFGEGKGSTILNANIIPEIHLSVHREIIDLRHGRYAHHGERSFLEKDVDVKYQNCSFIIVPKIEIGFYLGSPKNWHKLFEWLDGHMYNTIKNKLESLSKKSGVEWKFPHGPAPSYI